MLYVHFAIDALSGRCVRTVFIMMFTRADATEWIVPCAFIGIVIVLEALKALSNCLKFFFVNVFLL